MDFIFSHVRVNQTPLLGHVQNQSTRREKTVSFASGFGHVVSLRKQQLSLKKVCSIMLGTELLKYPRPSKTRDRLSAVIKIVIYII